MNEGVPARAESVVLAIVALLGAAGCDGNGSAVPTGIPMSDVFSVRDTIRLEEAPTDSIADIGAFTEAPDGGLVIGDALRPRVRRYSSSGRLLGSAGSYGSGPGEVSSIRGIAVRGDSIFLTDPRNGRIQVLDQAMNFIRTIRPQAAPAGGIVPYGDGFVMAAMTGRAGDRVAVIDSDGAVTWSGVPPARQLTEEAYWGSIARPSLHVEGDRLVVTDGLLYPLSIIDLDSGSSSVFGSPPPSYAQVTSVGRGAFALQVAAQAVQRWYDQFTTIGGVFGFGPPDSRAIAVVGSRLVATSQSLFEKQDYALDVYRSSDLTKLYSDVRLPASSRMLGGGRYLYVLVDGPPNPWTLVRLEP